MVKRKKMLDKILMVGFDAIPAALKAIKAGEVDATIRQNPKMMGSKGLELLVKSLRGEKIASKSTPV